MGLGLGSRLTYEKSTETPELRSVRPMSRASASLAPSHCSKKGLDRRQKSCIC